MTPVGMYIHYFGEDVGAVMRQSFSGSLELGMVEYEAKFNRPKVYLEQV